MFENKIYDEIMAEMMNSFGQNVRTDEGSLAHAACAKIAEKLEDVYCDLELVSENLLPDTQDLDHLIRYGSERGINYRYATNPIVRGEFKQEIEAGELLECEEYVYEVLEAIEGFNYKLKCLTAGAAANATLGELVPADYIEDYQGGEITEILIEGIDDEDEEIYRERVISSFNSIAFAGNKADYRKRINELEGVGGCKPLRRAKESAWVEIYIISSSFDEASSELVNKVQTAADPEENHGEGEGFAPICHNVKVYAAESVPINVTATISFDEGLDFERKKTEIEKAVQSYLLGLRKTWEKNEANDLVVRISRLESAILGVPGVTDISGLKINENVENLPIDFRKIPKFGGVSNV